MQNKIVRKAKYVIDPFNSTCYHTSLIIFKHLEGLCCVRD